jgi:hypothetical protein
VIPPWNPPRRNIMLESRRRIVLVRKIHKFYFIVQCIVWKAELLGDELETLEQYQTNC